MKNLIIIISIFFFSGKNQLHAQHFNPEKNNYLILSKNIQQLKPILLTAEALKKEDGKDYGDFHVVICGKTVRNITENTKFKELLKKLKEKNVKVFACGISLNKFNIDKNKLPSNLNVVDNGILYALQLTKKKFITLTI